MSRPLLLLVVLAALASGALLLLNLDSGDEQVVEATEESKAAKLESASPDAAMPELDDGQPEPVGAAPTAGTIGRTELDQRESLSSTEATVLVRGRIVDENGDPLPKAELVAVRTPSGMSGSQLQKRLRELFALLEGGELDDFPTKRQVVEPDGTVEFAVGNDFEEMYVFAQAEGRQIAIHLSGFDSSDKTCDVGELVLLPAYEVEIEVVGDDKRPIPKATVAIMGDMRKRTKNSMPLFVKTTDENGKCHFPYLGLGTLMVEAEAQGWARASTQILLEEDLSPYSERLILPRGAIVEGVVEHADGRPAAGVVMSIEKVEEDEGNFMIGFWISPLDYLESPEPWATTDQEGKFVGGGLQEDVRYTLNAQLDERVTAELEDVYAGDDVKITLPAAGSLSGHVVLGDDKTPLEGAKVYITKVRGRFRHWRTEPAETDAQGRFSQTLEAGSYRILVTHDEGQEAFDGPYKVFGPTDAETLEVTPGGTMLVRLFTNGSKAPIEEGEVSVEIDSSQTMPLGTLPKRADELDNLKGGATEREDGRYELTGLLPGHYTLSAEAKGHVSGELDFDIVSGQTTELALGLDTGASLIVTAVHSDGNPAAGMELRLMSLGASEEDDDVWESEMFSECDARGRAEFDRLMPGPYKIVETETVFLMDGNEPAALAQIELLPGKNELELLVPTKLSLRVVVRDQQGRPVPKAEVWSISHANPWGGWGWGGEDRTKTDERGVCQLDELAAGKHTVYAARDKNVPQSNTVDLQSSGQEVEVLLGGFRITGRILTGAKKFEVSLQRDMEVESEEDNGDEEEDIESAFQDFLRWMPYLHPGQAKLGPNGSFEFNDVPPGHYRIQVTGEDHYQPEETQPRIEIVDQDVNDVMIELRPAARLFLRVTGRSEDSEREIIARVILANGDTHDEWAYIGENEEYDFGLLPPGAHKLEICGQVGEEFDFETCTILAEFPVSLSAEQKLVIDWSAPADF